MTIYDAAAAPRLETDRLILRAPRPQDFPAFAAIWGDADVTRHIMPQPLSEGAAWSKFLRDAGHWAMLGYGFWIVEQRADGDIIGQIGFADLKRDVDAELDGRPEIGWALAARAQGKGLGSEAVRAAVAWGEHYFVAPMFCGINPDNVASLRLAEKCGFSVFARAHYGDAPILLLER